MPQNLKRTHPDTLLSIGLLISILLHLGLGVLFVLSTKGCESHNVSGAINPSEVVTVDLFGEVPNLTIPATPPPPRPPSSAFSQDDGPQDSQEPSQAAEVSDGSPQEGRVASPDAIPLGPKAQSPPPEIARRKAPPQVAPPAVKPPTPPAPPKRKSPPPQAEAPPRPAEKPRDLHDMVANTLGRGAADRMLGRPTGQVSNEELDRYYKRIMVKFRQNWKPSATGLSSQLQVAYTIVIDPDGNIFALHQVRSSGNPQFDRSVNNALRASSPLPPLPSGFGGRRHSVTLWFRPETY